MRITYSPRAVADIKQIASYLADRNPRVAAAVEQRIRLLVELIAQFPASGRVLEQRANVRVVPLGAYPYRIFYSVLDDELIVLHIRHAAQKPLDAADL